ncbi:MAG: hypothetical protein DI539_03605 [Flavobacterium psychrophilum]|nr:MAG: hypothetical protein DI539_03605 [Flavobacterium psychrophilum]
MKTKNILIAFALTALAQLAIPLKMVYDSEMTEREGTEYKFRTAPIDPSDPFRGKYIVLNYDIDVIPTKDSTWVSNEEIYVSLGTDDKGFARINNVSREEPETGDYIATKVDYYYDYNKSLHIVLPFDRYYMEESKAYDAEVAYRKYSSNEKAKPAYAVVAVKDGDAVLKDVIIDGMPIKDYVVKNRK